MSRLTWHFLTLAVLWGCYFLGQRAGLSLKSTVLLSIIAMVFWTTEDRFWGRDKLVPQKKIQRRNVISAMGFILLLFIVIGPYEPKNYLSLMSAIHSGDPAKVQSLLAQGANVNMKSAIFGESLLIQASGRGQPEIVKVLLQAGANPNAVDKLGYTALMMAPRLGHRDLVDELIAAGANPNARDNRGWTPLMRAVLNGNMDAVQAILRAGADVNAYSNSGNSALLLAIRKNHADIVETLLHAGANVNQASAFGTPLTLAARNGNLAIIKGLIDKGADIDAKDKSGMTALDHARNEKQTDAVAYLERRGTK